MRIHPTVVYGELHGGSQAILGGAEHVIFQLALKAGRLKPRLFFFRQITANDKTAGIDHHALQTKAYGESIAHAVFQIQNRIKCVVGSLSFVKAVGQRGVEFPRALGQRLCTMRVTQQMFAGEDRSRRSGRHQHSNGPCMCTLRGDGGERIRLREFRHKKTLKWCEEGGSHCRRRCGRRRPCGERLARRNNHV